MSDEMAEESTTEIRVEDPAIEDTSTQPKKWYVGKYMGLKNRKNDRSQSFAGSSSVETDRNSASNDAASEADYKERDSSMSKRSSTSGQTKGWYPGKFVGLRDRRKSSASSEGSDGVDILDTGYEPSQQTTWSTYNGDGDDKPRSRTISSWLSSFSKQDENALRDEQPHNEGDEDGPQSNRSSSTGGYYSNWFRRNNGNGSSKELNELEDTEADKEEHKKEAMITRTVRSIRNKFIERQLQGRILIYRTSGVVTTAVLCEINVDDKKSAEVTAEEIADLSYNDRRAITMTDTVLNSLERRSRAWDGCDFSKEVLLTRGIFIGVSDPFVGMVGFSIQIDFSATIQSLLASRRRFEAKVKADKEMALLNNPNGRESFFGRSISFSFNNSGNSSTGSDIHTHATPTLPASAFVNHPIVPVVKVESTDDLKSKIHLSEDDNEDDDDDGTKEI